VDSSNIDPTTKTAIGNRSITRIYINSTLHVHCDCKTVNLSFFDFFEICVPGSKNVAAHVQ